MAGSDREAELNARLAALEERLAAAEARARDAEARAVGSPMEALDALFETFLPAETLGHMRTARREHLLAVRSLVDAWIARVDRKAEAPARRRHESIPLEDA